jgi:hypothetical protein
MSLPLSGGGSITAAHLPGEATPAPTARPSLRCAGRRSGWRARICRWRRPAFRRSGPGPARAALERLVAIDRIAAFGRIVQAFNSIGPRAARSVSSGSSAPRARCRAHDHRAPRGRRCRAPSNAWAASYPTSRDHDDLVRGEEREVNQGPVGRDAPDGGLAESSRRWERIGVHDHAPIEMVAMRRDEGIEAGRRDGVALRFRVADDIAERSRSSGGAQCRG